MQSKFGTDPSAVADMADLGNCLQAAVASVLDLELDDVPHFVAVPGENGEWWRAMRRWAQDQGFDFAYIDSLDDVTAWGSIRHAIASGESPRGPWKHVVVVDVAGAVVHDPHPEGKGAGLVETDGYIVVVAPYELDEGGA